MADKLEFSLQSKDEWLQIFPYGVTIGLDQSRPVLVFKDKSEKHVLPVWLNSLDAGIAMAVSGDSRNLESPHSLSHEIFKNSKVQFKKCLFKSVKGHHQFVEVHFENEKKHPPVELRADYTMSLCLQEKVQFYCTIKHMERCRQLDVEMEQVNVAKQVGPNSPMIEKPGYLN